MYCFKCGNQNRETAQFCSECGAALAGVNRVDSSQISAKNPELDEIYKAVIGPKNQDKYLHYFLGADRLGRAPVSWHWPALFVTLSWLLYRKMWLAALVYFLLPYLVLIPLSIAAAAMGSASNFAAYAYVIFIAALFIVPSMYAKAAYYKHCKRKIAQVQKGTSDPQRQLGELTGRGGTSNIVLILVLIFGSIFVIGMVAAIALPAYQDYTVRAKVSEAVMTGRSAAIAVESFYSQNRRIPATLEETGFSARKVTFIRDVGVNPQNGVVSVTLAGFPIEGKALLMVPSEANGAITWKCQSDGISQKYLPLACR